MAPIAAAVRISRFKALTRSQCTFSCFEISPAFPSAATICPPSTQNRASLRRRIDLALCPDPMPVVCSAIWIVPGPGFPVTPKNNLPTAPTKGASDTPCITLTIPRVYVSLASCHAKTRMTTNTNNRNCMLLFRVGGGSGPTIPRQPAGVPVLGCRVLVSPSVHDRWSKGAGETGIDGSSRQTTSVGANSARPFQHRGHPVPVPDWKWLER
jgi:hypothetical protein